MVTKSKKKKSPTKRKKSSAKKSKATRRKSTKRSAGGSAAGTTSAAKATRKKQAKKRSKKAAPKKSAPKKGASKKSTVRNKSKKSGAKSKSASKSRRRKSAGETSADAVVGRSFPWHEITTRHPEKAKDFYSKLMNWTTSDMDMGGGFKYTMFFSEGKPVAGLMAMMGQQWEGIPPHWMTYLRVQDCDKSTSSAESLGATVMVPPTDIPNDIGRFSVIEDPTGAVISLYQSGRSPS